jgi:hypothetical protein
MADKKISQLTSATTPLAGTEVLPIVQGAATVKVATNDLTVKNIRSNATTGILQVAGPAAESTRVMTTPDSNFTAARTDAGQTFTGTNVFASAANASSVSLANTDPAMTSNVMSIYPNRDTSNGTYNLIGAGINGVGNRFVVQDSGSALNSTGSYGTFSDVKIKTDIVDAGSQWQDIKAIRFRKFKLKNDPDGHVQLGVVAQEIELVSPGLVSEHVDRDQEGNNLGTTTKSVKTSVLLFKAAVALQEAMTRIEQLEARLNSAGT